MRMAHNTPENRLIYLSIKSMAKKDPLLISLVSSNQSFITKTDTFLLQGRQYSIYLLQMTQV